MKVWFYLNELANKLLKMGETIFNFCLKKKTTTELFFGISWWPKKRGVWRQSMTSLPWRQTTSHSARPPSMASDHLPWHHRPPPNESCASSFSNFISPCQRGQKKPSEPIRMSSRDLSLLRRALRYERDTGEVRECMCACMRVISL